MTPAAGGVILSHPHGNANVRQAALAFAQAGRLRQFWTGVAWNPNSALARMLPRRVLRQLERRSLPEPVRPYLHLHPWREAARLASIELGWTSLTREGRLLSSGACHESLDRRVAQALDALARREASGAVYAYDHCALETFRAAGRVGWKRVYDLPTGHWRAYERLRAEELERWPDWAGIAPVASFDAAGQQRQDDEIRTADQIVVATRFTERTLREHFPVLAPIAVVPYGAPVADDAGTGRTPRARTERLRVLYVGSLGLLKGIPYLFEALRACGRDLEVTVVGRARGECAALSAALAGVRYLPSLPNPEVLALMEQSDVFVFPSLFDGFGLVITEAMSRGCAVITTPNTAGPELMTDGEDGFIVPIRDAGAIAACLAALDDDRDRLAAVQAAALARARRQPWESYREGVRRATFGA